jgi:hypothetical protein
VLQYYSAQGFAGLQPIGLTGQLLAMASGRVPGDEGLLLLDLAGGVSRLFPTRKLTARGLKAGGESQVVVYDPGTGAASLVENPAQV